MGFFDSFKRGYQQETTNRAEGQQYSSYKTLETIEREQLMKLKSKSDAELMREYKSSLTRKDEEHSEKVLKILNSRGITWDQESRRFDPM